MFIRTLTARTANLAKKWEPASHKGEYENFLNVFAKSPLLSAYHIEADCCDWTVPTLYDSLDENVL